MKSILAILMVLSLSLLAEESEGKVFVKSEPPGAMILLASADGSTVKDTGKVTPALVQVPVGKAHLILALAAYKAADLNLNVDGSAIFKPEPVKLEKIKIIVDLIFEDGWRVSLDGKIVKDVKGAPASTPCTVELIPGPHSLTLNKDGYQEIVQSFEAKVDTPVEITTKPVKSKVVPGARKVKVLVYNAHNAHSNNVGAKECIINLLDKGQSVWQSPEIPLAVGKEDPATAIDIPDSVRFSAVKVTITKSIGLAGALSEVEVVVNGTNIALGKKVTSSGGYPNGDHRESYKFLTDGIRNSQIHLKGYWVATTGQAWAEIDLNTPSNSK